MTLKCVYVVYSEITINETNHCGDQDVDGTMIQSSLGDLGRESIALFQLAEGKP